MATVRSLVLELAIRVDPRDANGVEFVVATIGVNDGQRFTKQRLLDIYNEARISLFNEAKTFLPTDLLSKEFGGVAKSAAITFSSYEADKPSDFIKLISLSSSAGPVYLLDSEIDAVNEDSNPDFIESATNRFIFDIGSKFVHLHSFVNGAHTIRYYGMANWTLADVTGGTVVETIGIQHHPNLISLAELIALEYGAQDIAAAARRFLGAK